MCVELVELSVDPAMDERRFYRLNPANARGWRGLLRQFQPGSCRYSTILDKPLVPGGLIDKSQYRQSLMRPGQRS